MKRWQLLVVAALVVLAAVLLMPRRRAPSPEPGAGTVGPAPSAAPPPTAAPPPPPPLEPPAREEPAPEQLAAAPRPAEVSRPAPAEAPTRRAAPEPAAGPGTTSRPPASIAAALGAAAASGRATAPATVAPPSPRSEPGGGRVLGRVRSARGPVTRFSVNGRPVSDPSGAFRVEARRGGTVRVAVRADGFATALERARQVRGDTVLPDVVLEPGFAVIAEIVDAVTQAPVPEAHAALADAEDVEEAWQAGEPMTAIVEPAATGRGGMLLLERVPRGNWLMLVHHPGYRLELSEFRPQDQATRVALHRGGSVAGRVVGVGGQPLGGARVTAVSRSALDAAEGRADADGRFRLGPLHPGWYAVLAVAHDGAQPLGSISVVVRDGEVAAADFRARAGGATVAVRVLDARGQVAGASALIAPGEVKKPASLSELLESSPIYPATGRGPLQVIPSVPAGRHTLFVLGRSGEVAWRQEVEVPARGTLPLEVRLPGEAALSLAMAR